MTELSLPFTDLLMDSSRWSSWSPRKEIEPNWSVEIDAGPGGRSALVIAGNGNRCASGCWRQTLPELRPGRRYRVEALFKCDGVLSPGSSVRAILSNKTTSDHDEMFFYDHLDYLGEREGWHVVGQTIAAEEDTPELTLNLFLSWEASGRVLWGDPRLYDISEVEARRPVRFAAISGNPENPKSPAECIAFYCEKLDEIPEADLVVLPELINATRLDMPLTDLAEPIPGPTYEYLSDKARSRGFYIAASLLEREADALYNTGILIDRAGGIVGRYRKTHLAPGEDLLQGTAPGYDYPIFETDFGNVGYMICYDAHFPEVARILSLKGADTILFSNMGDGREGGTLWEPFIRMRALDNQIHIVAAVNGGRSCVVSPKGEILAISDRERGAWVSAECDLDTSACNYSGRPIRGRYNLYRREETFDSLGRPLWEM